MKTSDAFLAVAGAFVVIGSIFMHFAQPKTKPAFKPMELACVDITGKVAAHYNTLRYYRDGGTIVGADEASNTYVYTPPQGWVCRFGEIKK